MNGVTCVTDTPRTLQEWGPPLLLLCAQDVDAGRLWAGQPAPPIAQAYWKLPPDATMRDLLLAVRADEACHSHVNHTFAGLPQDEVNPFTRKGSDMP